MSVGAAGRLASFTRNMSEHSASFQIMAGDDLAARYEAVREHTEALAAPLSAEDQLVQSMPDVSPTKWHRAHTTWFFETFLLKEHLAGYVERDPAFAFLFNSYYEAVGSRHARDKRGLISRPSLDEVAAYRAHVDAAMQQLLAGTLSAEVQALVVLGLNHEQQHQELLLMDIHHVLSCNPTDPAYVDAAPLASKPAELRWIAHPGGLVEIGVDAATNDSTNSQVAGFAYDNEGPRHKVYLEPFHVSSTVVRNGDWLDFIADGGYATAALWLSDGWSAVQSQGWNAPLYWRSSDDGWAEFTLHGLRSLDVHAPVCHISHYEADAFARWAGGRLPTEAEWEASIGSLGAAETPRALTPTAIDGDQGQVWEWTASPYVGYPGFAPAAGAVGEYNGKFMSNQQVLRGGACITPSGHVRPTYRNFFPASARWAVSGVRIARDA